MSSSRVAVLVFPLRPWGSGLTTQQKNLLARIRPLVIIAVVGAVYSRGLSGGLLLGWDDDRFIVDSGTANDVSLGSLASMFTAQHFEAYHPLHLLSYWLDVPWFGHGGPAIHVVSLVLWIAALLVLMKVFDRFGLSPGAALIAVLFFGLHPIQVEAVTWATGRKDILAALFSFLTLLCHVKSRGRWDGNAWATRVFFVCAALSKTTTLTLPGVLLLHDLLIAGKGWRRSLAGQIPLLLLGGALSAVVVAIWSDNDMIRPDTIAGPATRAAASVTHHVLTAIAPLDTAAVYPVNRPGDFAWTAYLIPAALLAALVVSLWRRWRAGAFVLSAFLLLMLPVANVVPMYWHWMDRYLSLPLFCFALGLGLLLDRLGRGPRVAVRVTAHAASALLLLALSARTAVHHVRYTDDLALRRSAPSSGRSAASRRAGSPTRTSRGHTRCATGWTGASHRPGSRRSTCAT